MFHLCTSEWFWSRRCWGFWASAAITAPTTWSSSSSSWPTPVPSVPVSSCQFSSWDPSQYIDNQYFESPHYGLNWETCGKWKTVLAAFRKYGCQNWGSLIIHHHIVHHCELLHQLMEVVYLLKIFSSIFEEFGVFSYLYLALTILSSDMTTQSKRVTTIIFVFKISVKYSSKYLMFANLKSSNSFAQIKIK